MPEPTILSAETVAEWAESARRYPIFGSDILEHFQRLAASHEQLRELLAANEFRTNAPRRKRRA
jgi:hypothetical protein